MRRLGIAFLVLALGLLSRARAFAGDGAFESFRVPENAFHSWVLTLDGVGSWDHTTQGAVRARTSRADGRGASEFRARRESERWSRSVDALVTAAVDRNHSADETSPLPGDPLALVSNSGHVDFGVQQIRITGSERHFATGLPLFLGGTASLSNRFQQQNQKSISDSSLSVPSARRHFHDKSLDTNYDVMQFAASLDVGVGHVRNATGYFEARVLEERLRKAGALSRALSGAARQRLAAIFYARDAVELTRDRPASSAWAAIESVLREDGALDERGIPSGTWLDASSPFLHGFDPDPSGLPVSPVVRQTGASASASIHWQRFREHAHFASTYADRVDSAAVVLTNDAGSGSGNFFQHSASQLAFGLDGDFHRSLSDRLQFDVRGSAEWPFAGSNRIFTSAAGAVLSWCVADRWLATTSSDYAYESERSASGRTIRRSRASSLRAGLEYFVTDRLGVTASLLQRWSHEDGEAGGPLPTPLTDLLESGGQFDFGLTYRLSGFARIADVFPVTTAP